MPGSADDETDETDAAWCAYALAANGAPAAHAAILADMEKSRQELASLARRRAKLIEVIAGPGRGAATRAARKIYEIPEGVAPSPAQVQAMYDALNGSRRVRAGKPRDYRARRAGHGPA